MPVVKFLPANKIVEAPVGAELLDAAKLAGVEIDAPCGGKGTCGKCAVLLVQGKVKTNTILKQSDKSVYCNPANRSENNCYQEPRRRDVSQKNHCLESYQKEWANLHPDTINASSENRLRHERVLACQSKIADTDIIIEIAQRLGDAGGQFSDSASANELIDADLFPQISQCTSHAFQVIVNVDFPKTGDGLSDIDRLQKALAKSGYGNIEIPLKVIQTVATVIRNGSGYVCCTLIHRADRKLLLARIDAGEINQDLYGCAIDIGTTTVAVHLVRLFDRVIIATQTEYNDQITCGLDVISRINYAQRNNGLAELHRRVVETINKLLEQVCDVTGADKSLIFCLSISGNTTMTHLLLALDPEYIRLDPYTPTILDAGCFTANDIGLDVNPFSQVQIAPAVGSYVGGDIMSGLLCTNIARNCEKISLFIDIGTNGEIILGNNEFLLACACSAGPAFEGGGIECGMRAAQGAIDNIKIDVSTGEISYSTIGSVPALGICGSAMIMLVAALFRSGIIDMSGKFIRDKKYDAIKISGRQAFLTIVDSSETGHGQPVYISETDINNIIRTKGAIFSACTLMLRHVGLSFDDLSSMYIAGGFGRCLNIRDAITIGMLPDLPEEKFHYIGNSSLAGSYMTLLSDTHCKVRDELAKRMTYLDLSTESDYMDHYTAAMFLPHTDERLFPGVIKKR
jgi:uncharacterized 2Fe-2S/4Fe-4S cluster protein (DUF4445 family)